MVDKIGVTSFMTSYHCGVLPHLLYSAGMSSPDIHLFLKQKNDLEKQKLVSQKALFKQARPFKSDVPNVCLATGIQDLPHKCSSVIRKDKCYIEGLQKHKVNSSDTSLDMKPVSLFLGGLSCCSECLAYRVSHNICYYFDAI